MLDTERINEKTVNIDKCSAEQILELINDEDATVAGIVRGVIPRLVKVVDIAVAAIQKGGRLIYCGAGTSGRLAVADAAELYPTYGLKKGTVIAVMAGGAAAITDALENKEDDALAGKNRCMELNVGENDVVIGVSASGGAAFVVSFMQEAKSRGAAIVSIVNNASTAMSRIANISVEALTGAEVIKGSTRMKAGTSQKMMLNMLSTAICVRLGRVYRNLMTEMNVSNSKLRVRGAAIVSEVTNVPTERAAKVLEKCGYSIRKAIETIEAEDKL